MAFIPGKKGFTFPLCFKLLGLSEIDNDNNIV